MDPQLVELLLHGGNIGAIGAAIWVIVWAVRKLANDDNLKKNYPPHRHANGTITYSLEYPPPKVERVNDH